MAVTGNTKSVGDNKAAIPYVIPIDESGTAVVPARAGVSLRSSVGAASATIIAAATYAQSVTLQNTHASQSLYVSFSSPALTTDFHIPAGAALTLPFGPTNALYGIASGANTTFTAIGA